MSGTKGRYNVASTRGYVKESERDWPATRPLVLAVSSEPFVGSSIDASFPMNHLSGELSRNVEPDV